MVVKVLLVWFAASVPASVVVGQLLARAGRAYPPVAAPVPVPARAHSAA